MESRTITDISQCARCDRICNNVSDYNNRNVVINFTPSIPYSLNVTKLLRSCIYCTYNSAWRDLIKICIFIRVSMATL